MDDVRNFAQEEYERIKEQESMRMVPIKAPSNFDDIKGKQEDNKGKLCNEYLRFCKCKFLKNNAEINQRRFQRPAEANGYEWAEDEARPKF